MPAPIRADIRRCGPLCRGPHGQEPGKTAHPAPLGRPPWGRFDGSDRPVKAIRLKVASSTKEFERLFGIPARTMESYEQGRRNLDGAMRALLRIIDREPKAACRALTS